MVEKGKQVNFTVRRHYVKEQGVLYINFEVSARNNDADFIIAQAKPQPTLNNGIYQDIYYRKGSTSIVFEFEYKVEEDTSVLEMLGKTTDVYSRMLKSVFPPSDLTDQFVSETIKALKKQKLFQWQDFDFKVGIDSDDYCSVDAIADYEPKELVEPTVDGNRYTFKEVKKTFVIKYSHHVASVSMISCNKTSPCQGFSDKNTDDEIYGSVLGDTVRIDLVIIGAAQGAGHCSKAISYMIKVLLIESAKIKEFPYKGEVNIDSLNPCQAVNCYAHAFINNGFSPDAKQLKAVKERLKGNSISLSFTLKGFLSEEQRKKHNKEDSIAKRVKNRRTGFTMAPLKL